MDKQVDALLEFGSLKFMSSVFRRFLGFVIGAKVLVVVITIFTLSGCMSSMPSTFPDIQLPSPQSSSGTPSPSSSSSPPTGSTQPQPNSGSQSSLPSPSSPGSPSSGNPSLPRPPSPIPSPDSSNGNPSTPSLPSPESQGSPTSGESSDGNTTPESSEGEEGQQEGQEGTMGDNMELPSGDVQFPAGDSNGQADSNQDGGMMIPEGEESGDGMMIPEDEENGGGGWETSNQLEPQAGDSEENGSGDEEELESTTISSSGEDEMQEVLGDLDGEIMNERNAANTRANDEVAEAGSFETETGETESGIQDGDTDGDDTAEDSEQRAGTGAGEQDEPLLPETQQGVADTPDATDKNVVARQLKEAAIAEEDPELKEKLWEEYEAYVDGLK